jgi:hypothetical protein
MKSRVKLNVIPCVVKSFANESFWVVKESSFVRFAVVNLLGKFADLKKVNKLLLSKFNVGRVSEMIKKFN